MDGVTHDPMLDSMRHAIETRDSGGLSGFYADDAVILVMDRDHPPSAPMRISGRAEIDRFHADLCGRDVTHAVETAVAAPSHLAFTERCTYPNGAQVFCSAMLDRSDGRIVRQVMVQVWDG